MIMSTERPSDLSHLLPDRYPQTELFICDVADAVLKDFVQEMEHPFYSLSKKPVTSVRRYEHNGDWLEITPSVKGQATIYDKDILIYCISQIMAKLNAKQKVSKRVRINSRDLLIFTNRGTAGKDYKALCDSVDRLAGTRISTNIRTGDEEEYRTFGLVDAATIRRKYGLNGRLLYVDLQLSDWVFNAIRSNNVLTLNRDYFRLRKPIERRIYELARKHCGRQPIFRISLELLHRKSGSWSSLREFRRAIKGVVEDNYIPDYVVEFNEENDSVTFFPKKDEKTDVSYGGDGLPPLSPTTYEKAKQAAPRYDVYALEEQWRAHWVNSGKEPLKNPAAAFVGFCRNRYKSNPNP